MSPEKGGEPKHIYGGSCSAFYFINSGRLSSPLSSLHVCGVQHSIIAAAAALLLHLSSSTLTETLVDRRQANLQCSV